MKITRKKCDEVENRPDQTTNTDTRNLRQAARARARPKRGVGNVRARCSWLQRPGVGCKSSYLLAPLLPTRPALRSAAVLACHSPDGVLQVSAIIALSHDVDTLAPIVCLPTNPAASGRPAIVLRDSERKAPFQARGTRHRLTFQLTLRVHPLTHIRPTVTRIAVQSSWASLPDHPTTSHVAVAAEAASLGCRLTAA